MRFPVISLLAKTGHLKTPKETMLLAMETDVEQVRLSGGETLFRKGEIADSLYIVMSGRLRVFSRTPDGKEFVAGEIGRGDTVGEMAVLANQPRSATVRAVRDTEILRVTKATFDDLATRHPSIILKMMRTVIDRLEQSRQQPYSVGSFVPTTITVVPLSPRVPIRDFVHRLESALSGVDSTLYLNRELLDKSLWKGAADTPRDHSNNSEIVNWLNEREATNRFFLYETDAHWSSWTNRCLRQADCVLLVGMADDPPDLCEIEVEMQREWISQTGVRKELVLLHADRKVLPQGTSKWLKNRIVNMHHQVSLRSRDDFDRLRRFLTGQAIGLVLGGGGARAFAHIGVVRALRESGIPIDIIGGVSMGAFLGAQLALGWDAKQMAEYTRECFSRLKPFNDFTLPFLGLVTGYKFKRIAKQLYGDGQMEDLWSKFFCLSSNLTTAEVMVHERGPIWRWLCASIAVPGVGPPLFDEGCLLSDGGVLNNLPIDVMRRFIEGIVIASDVSPQTDLRVDPDANRPPTTVEILWNRLNPFAERMHFPGILDILFRVAEVSGVSAVKAMKHRASLYIHPPTEAYSMFDFKKVDELVEIGYRDAIGKVENWKKELPAESETLFKDRITRPL